MKGNPAVPGGSSISKPTWSKTSGFSATSVFFVFGAGTGCKTGRDVNQYLKKEAPSWVPLFEC